MDINDIQDQIIDEFASLEDRFEKYELLIKHGMQMPAMDKKYKTDRYAVKGCQSRLWIPSEVIDGRMIFHADSDSEIVRGMAAVVLKVVNIQSPDQVTKADLYFIYEIGLRNHLSPVRANGLASIVKRIYELAHYSVTQDQERNFS